MSFRQVRFVFQEENNELMDILIALLGDKGYEGFHSEENVLNAYLESKNFKTGQLEDILSGPVFSSANIRYEISDLPEKNWNAEWESSYAPVVVDDICAIIAPFHEVPDVKHVIKIEPKMSFGTGHHETTRLMIRHINDVSPAGSKILDMGCGTGILGIFALMENAEFVTAIDIDSWACENSRENMELNGIESNRYEVIMGGEEKIPAKVYDLILANINKNTLIPDMKVYREHLSEGGVMVLSGILNSDRVAILEEAEKQQLQAVQEAQEGKWLSVRLKCKL